MQNGISHFRMHEQCIHYRKSAAFLQIQNGQFDVTTVLSIAKPMLDSVEERGQEVNEEGLKSDIKNCTAQSK
jgi:hypothetical protein